MAKLKSARLAGLGQLVEVTWVDSTSFAAWTSQGSEYELALIDDGEGQFGVMCVPWGCIRSTKTLR